MKAAKAILVAVGLVACGGSSGPAQTTGGATGGSTAGTGGAANAPSQANPLDAERSALLAALNLRRAMANVPTVTSCTSLNVSASGHSDDMRDHDYLSDVSPIDMSNVRTRGCKAGYSAACGTTIPMSELVAEGNGTGDAIFAQWTSDATASPILIEPSFVVVGLGRSVSNTNDYWTLDLASMADPSCN